MLAPPKPPHDELELLIKEARERQLRRRLLGAAGLAVSAALGLAVYALTVGGNQPAESTAQRGPAVVCRSAQLSGSTGFQGATQTMLGGVTIQNTSNAACSLPQLRPLVTISWRGKVLPTEERPMRTGPPWPRAHVLAPGRKASVFWQWWTCGAFGVPQAAVRPTLTLRFGPRLVVSARADESTPPSCSGLGGRHFLDVTHALVYR